MRMSKREKGQGTKIPKRTEHKEATENNVTYVNLF